MAQIRYSNVIYWCKWITSYYYVQKYKQNRFDWYDMEVENNPYKVGFLPPSKEKALESPLSEIELSKTADEVFSTEETSEKDAESQKMVHVKFALMWRATTDAFDFLSDINNKILATGLAKVKWNTYLPPVEKLYNALNCYAQCGVIMGTMNVDGMDEELNLYLFGEKLRFLGKKVCSFSQVLGNIPKNGRFVHLAKVSIPNVVENLTFGFATSLTGCIESFKDTKTILQNVSDKEKMEKT
ncbi:phosphoenolpyruvate synthase [Caerostris extrusa]|uniref:Phosphoenolpyruvate synthase n=1 Tax=Caerostris extrusa TaxID=172846 RepID=A0AAV4SLZ5_CAEEX|nr:phosphoenolpyruvate synthase [Caerostris extrusa]